MREKTKESSIWSKKDVIIMWSTWVKGITLLLLISAVLAQTEQEGCTCARLGPGSNPCTCNNVIVEATEVTKPILYASPEEINEAVIVREDERPACSETQTNTLSILENSINDDTISSSDNSFSLDLSKKHLSSELRTDIAQTEPTSPNSNVQIVPK
ncbi:PREDICTED: uncharacterized protein LOC107072044 [Polistes dominula]|uniref:Uncharacterized protein LOC107072044 n=1 Tax=Polistes dominula TaxID=743375 RepID=A0ABM1J3S4_POLDO|nr:PREDICTED: uncharacterized protein LOC107072044 [Polistes dominula]